MAEIMLYVFQKYFVTFENRHLSWNHSLLNSLWRGTEERLFLVHSTVLLTLVIMSSYKNLFNKREKFFIFNAT